LFNERFGGAHAKQFQKAKPKKDNEKTPAGGREAVSLEKLNQVLVKR
jgi:hypothetical protein